MPAAVDPEAEMENACVVAAWTNLLTWHHLLKNTVNVRDRYTAGDKPFRAEIKQFQTIENMTLKNPVGELPAVAEIALV